MLPCRLFYLLKKAYFDMTTKDLGRKLDSELGGNLEQLIFNVLQASVETYDPHYHTDAKMKDDIEKLYKMGQGKMGTDEKGLFKLLCPMPPEYIQKVNSAYADKYGYTLVKTMEKELGGDVEKAAMFMVGMKLKPYEVVAQLVNTACAGFGTNELLLTSVLIRYQAIMKEVMIAHIELYGRSIEDRVNAECGGDFKLALLEILKTAENM
jgi:annexin A7/11